MEHQLVGQGQPVAAAPPHPRAEIAGGVLRVTRSTVTSGVGERVCVLQELREAGGGLPSAYGQEYPCAGSSARLNTSVAMFEASPTSRTASNATPGSIEGRIRNGIAPGTPGR